MRVYGSAGVKLRKESPHLTHVETDAPNRADFGRSERAQQSLDVLLLARPLARLEDAPTREHLDFDRFSGIRSQTDILVALDGLADERLAA